MVHIRRRQFLGLLGGAAAAWPVVARAQHQMIPVVGFLSTRGSDDGAHLFAGFRRGLAEYGYVEGQNVTVEYRWAHGQYDRLPGLAAELARRPVTIFVTAGGERAALAARGATTTVPVVFVVGSDPVRLGLVASYNRPGGRITGVHIMSETLEAKRLGLLHELIPQATTIGVLVNPDLSTAANQLSDIEGAARAIGLQVHVLRASTDREIEVAFEAVELNRIRALVVTADPFFNARRDKLVTLSANYSVPTVYQFREYAVAGGLMSYGTSLTDAYRQAGIYTARILKGEKAGDLPVEQPTKFELVINLKTAKTLGLNVPSSMQLLADDLVE
jgi:putative ABC transport system substrate-binding protein